ncbi:MAG: thioredoxin domain-containing protein [Bacillota bacterium]
MSEPQTTNRLIYETSPYLLRHAHHPVDWYPWGEEAFQKAKEEDKPILLSCGYSACHWCHVMARESFEDPDIAELMNAYFVNIKVDREERPDIDQLYQQAVQLMTGQGGWPLTVFLDLERKPFFGGTYFPPKPLYGRSSFPWLLETIHDKWVNQREEIKKAGSELQKYMQTSREAAGEGRPPEPEIPERAGSELIRTADRRNGGFGGAPKFPNPSLLQLFLKVGVSHRKQQWVDQVLFALGQMSEGGIYDHLGGGFHRYSTDQYWLVPHFEKMLYDNAQLLKIYAIGYQLTESEDFKRVARETADYIQREMTAPEGGFYATQDADSEGVEGRFYLWDLEEIQRVLTPEEAHLVIDYYGLTAKGNFEGKNILNRLYPADRFRKNPELSPVNRETLNRAKEKLFKLREQRVKPFRDEKIIISWNGLMIGALAYSYQVFQRDEDYMAGKRAAEFILSRMKKPDGGLSRIFKDGRAKIDGMLDDYAFLTQGLLDLYEADFKPSWLEESLRLTGKAIELYGNNDGTYCLTTQKNELIIQPLSGQDLAIPSGVSVHTENLLRLAVFTGRRELRREAEKILAAYAPEMKRDAWSHAGLLTALDAYYQEFKEFTFISEEAKIPEILVKLRRSFIPYRVLVWGHGKQPNLTAHPAGELLQNRYTLEGKPTCYACHQMSCLPPVTEWEQLRSVIEK